MMNYKRICLLLLWLPFAVNAFPLYDGIELSWSYPANETVSFNLSVPLSLIEQNAISWLFLGFRPSNEAPKSNYMDVVLVNLTTDSIEDEFPNERGFPQLDKDLNGTDDLFDKFAGIAGENKYLSWSRNFLSNDTKDVSFISGQLYALLWVYGNFDTNGKWQITKSGSQPITFNNSRILHDEQDYRGDAKGDNRDDDRGDGDKDSNDNGEVSGNDNGSQDNDDYDFDDDDYEGSNDDGNDYDYDDSGNKTLKINPLLSGSIERFIMPIWILSIFLV